MAKRPHLLARVCLLLMNAIFLVRRFALTEPSHAFHELAVATRARTFNGDQSGQPGGVNNEGCAGVVIGQSYRPHLRRAENFYWTGGINTRDTVIAMYSSILSSDLVVQPRERQRLAGCVAAVRPLHAGRRGARQRVLPVRRAGGHVQQRHAHHQRDASGCHGREPGMDGGGRAQHGALWHGGGLRPRDQRRQRADVHPYGLHGLPCVAHDVPSHRHQLGGRSERVPQQRQLRQHHVKRVLHGALRGRSSRAQR
jgi:hypothetical protein